jgi:hypothetical protein
MLELQVNKLAFFVAKKTMTLSGLQKRVIISGNEFKRIKAVISLENNFLRYVGLSI